MVFAWTRKTVARFFSNGPASRPRPAVRRKAGYRPMFEALENRVTPAVRGGFDGSGLVRQDDSPSLLANLGFTANFFGSTQTQVWVNNNGNITFGGSLSTYTPFGLTGTSAKIIAPFFADVDTRGAGGVTAFGTSTIDGHNAFGATWVGVNYFNATRTEPPHADKFNTFQVILIDQSVPNVPETVGNFDIEFNYDGIQWETGDASSGANGLGGRSAHVGYANGGATAPGSSFEFAGSGVPGSFLNGGTRSLVAGTNTGVAGRYVFAVRNGQVDPPLSPDTGAAFNINENDTISAQQVATFFDGDPHSDVGNFSQAQIDWGDGTTTAGTIVRLQAGNPANGTPAKFEVRGTHKYRNGRPDDYPIKVRVVSTGGSATEISAKATVAEAPFSIVSTSAITATEGQEFNGTLLTFQDSDVDAPLPAPGSFQVKINWNDGTDEQTVTPTQPGGPGTPLQVVATHVFERAGQINVRVTITDTDDDAPQTIQQDVAANVTNATILGQAADDLVAVEGASFLETLGSFSDLDPSKIGATDNYEVTVHWGDGTISQSGGSEVLVSPFEGPPGAAVFAIAGTHTYRRQGNYSVVIEVLDKTGGDDVVDLRKALQVSVTDAPISVTVTDFEAFKDLELLGEVARFLDANPLSKNTDFSGVIEWGDGTTTTFDASNISQPGGPGTPYVVTSKHTYATFGDKAVRVTVTEAAPGGSHVAARTVKVKSRQEITRFDVAATVDGVVQIIGRVIAVSTMEFGSVVSGTRFTLLPQFAYLAACYDFHWLQIIVDETAGAGGVIQWNGANAPMPRVDPPEGAYDNNPYPHPEPWYLTRAQEAASNEVSPTGAIFYNMSDSPRLLGGGLTFETYLCVAPKDTLSGSFDVLGGYHWTAGSHGGPEELLGKPGRPSDADMFRIDDAIVNSNRAFYTRWSPSLFSFNLSCHDLHVFPPANPLSESRGVQFTRVVATFADPHPNPNINEYSATITWEDGTVSVATAANGGIVATANSHNFAVVGTHTPPTSGDFTYSVVVTHVGGASEGITAPISIHNMTVAALGPFIIDEGVEFAGAVAVIADTNPNEPASMFSATIDWGDGTASSNATIVALGGGLFTVEGIHTYEDPGVYPITIAVIDQDGDTAPPVATAILVNDAPLTSVGAPTTYVVREGDIASNYVVATFVDEDPHSVASEFFATINWGDGTFSAGIVQREPNSGTRFEVLGTHQYADDNAVPFPVTVNIISIPGGIVGSTLVCDNVSFLVTNAPVDTNFQSIAGIEGTPIVDAVVGRFTNRSPIETQAEFTAMINWGDNTPPTPGTIVTVVPDLFSVQFAILGTHTYIDDGEYEITISIVNDGVTTVMTSEAVLANAPFAVIDNARPDILELDVAASSTPQAIIAGPNGSLWFLATATNKLGRLDFGTGLTEFNLADVSLAHTGLTMGPDRNIWVAETTVNRIARVNTTTLAITKFAVPTANGQPMGITAGPDGNLWFTERTSGKIGRLNPLTGAITEFRVPRSGVTLQEIIAGPDGNLWFTMTAAGFAGIGRITPGGVVSEFRIGSGTAAGDMASGADGNIYFTLPSRGRIGRISTAGAITEIILPNATGSPQGIVSGLDGNLWFTEASANRINRLTPGLSLSTFNVPTGGSGPFGITVGPDGSLWFTERTANQIGAVNPSLVFPGADFVALQGNRFTLPLASFVNGNPFETAVDFAPTRIEWDDGTAASAGIVVPKFGGGFDVFGSHIYNAVGVYDVTVQIKDVDGGRVDTTVTVNVFASRARSLAFTSAPQPMTTGTNSSPIVVTLLDGSGNVVNATSNLVISLASSSPTGRFRNLSNGPITTVTIAAGTSSASFFYTDTVAGTPTITARRTGLSAASQVELVQAPPKSVALVGVPAALTAGVTSTAIRIFLRNAANQNILATVDRVVSLSTNSPAGMFVNASGVRITSVVIPRGSNNAVVFYRDTRAAKPTLRAAIGGLTAGTALTTVKPAAASRIVFSTPPRTVALNAATAVITVQLRDAFNNVVTSAAARTVSLTTTSARGRFLNPTTRARITSIVMPKGASSVSFLYTDGNRGQPTITAKTGTFVATQVVKVL